MNRSAGSECDPSLRQAVATIIWSAPRLKMECPELTVVRDAAQQLVFSESVMLTCLYLVPVQAAEQFIFKFGKDYAHFVHEQQGAPNMPKDKSMGVSDRVRTRLPCGCAANTDGCDPRSSSGWRAAFHQTRS
jgi:hypothetical protein